MNIVMQLKRKIRNVVKKVQEERKFKDNLSIVKGKAHASQKNHNVIVDCGFNQGKVAERLLNELYDFSFIGFEIQQDIKHFGEKIKKQFPCRDIKIIYSAVGRENGTVSYFEPKVWGKNYKGGTTTVKNKSSMAVNYEEPRQAPSIDFSEWLSGNISEKAFVFVKMDIEGGEYEVIESLLDTGAIELIDVLAVEWHANKFPEPQRSQYKAIENRAKEYAKKNSLVVLDWY